MKTCLYCKTAFYKKYTHSKTYWSNAKYCSVFCGRMSNNPAKLKPNKVEFDGECAYILVSSKKGNLKFKIDKSVYLNNKEINSSRWSATSYGYLEKSYTIGNIHKRKILHTLILLPKKGFVIDHINNDTFDNRLCNLRYLTFSDNIRNHKLNNKYGVSGASKTKSGSFVVKIQASNKTYHVGTYKTIEEARKARINAEIQYWGKSFLKEKVI